MLYVANETMYDDDTAAYLVAETAADFDYLTGRSSSTRMYVSDRRGQTVKVDLSDFDTRCELKSALEIGEIQVYAFVYDGDMERFICTFIRTDKRFQGENWNYVPMESHEENGQVFWVRRESEKLIYRASDFS